MRFVERCAAVLVCAVAAGTFGGCPTDPAAIEEFSQLAGILESNLKPQKTDPTAGPGIDLGEEPAPGRPPLENGPEPVDSIEPQPLPPQEPLDLRGTGLPYGKWVLESGAMLDTFVTGLATFSVTTDTVALELYDDGSARVVLRDRMTGATDCVRAFAIFDGQTLALDVGAESGTFSNLAVDQKTFVFPVVVSDAQSLGLADAAGQIALFRKVTELPPEADCGTLEVLDRFDGLPPAQFFSDLVLFNGDLVYSTSTEIQAFDLATDTLAAPLGATSGRLVQTTQGGFLWTHCGCGGSRDAFKRTLLILADTVSSETEMGGPITFRAMAFSTTTDRLWLHGRDFDDQFGRFYVMNTNGEPDIIDQQISFNRDLRALAFDGTELWGLVTVASQSVVRIDTATGQVLASFEVPDEDVSWGGLVFDDLGQMYLMGTDGFGQGVITRLAHP